MVEGLRHERTVRTDIVQQQMTRFTHDEDNGKADGVWRWQRVVTLHETIEGL